MHFIPTYSSWLNQVERFFALITGRPYVEALSVRSGNCSSAIDQFVSHYNDDIQAATPQILEGQRNGPPAGG